MFRQTRFYKFAALTIALTLLVATPVFAQSETDPLAEPEPEQVEVQSLFFGSKIVQMIADFFAHLFNPPVSEPPAAELPESEPPADDLPGDELPGDEVPAGDPVEEVQPDPVIVPAEFIASLHEDENMGFGEIVKILDLANTVAATCAETGEFCDVTYETLLAEYEESDGMGALFAKYGKPENLGVGHLQNEPPGQSTNNGKAKGKDKGN